MGAATLREIVETLEGVAGYDGPWLHLRGETALLRRRVAELRERETRLDDALVIALVGGSGVGKSTLLNALAGDQIAKTSELRPCTSAPTVYHPPGVTLPFGGWNAIARSALEHLIIVDTPDSDTIAREHRERVIEVLAQCDLILLCGSAEKYLDEATWSLLRPLQRERTVVCVETKAYGPQSVREHWLGRLREHGFEIPEYFRVNALRSLDRKLRGNAPPDPDEFDFPRLEVFLGRELNAERIARIKRSNAAGLLSKTVSRLRERLAEHAAPIGEAEAALHAAETELTRTCMDIVEARLFEEPHLWSFALRRETSLRAKGIAGSILRFVDALLNLPARMVGWLPAMAGLGGRAAADEGHRALFQDDLKAAAAAIAGEYRAKESEVRLALAKAGFDLGGEASALPAYQRAIDARVNEVLRGPARDVLVQQARLLTSWPVMAGADVPFVAFLLYFGGKVVWTYLPGGQPGGVDLFDTGFFTHSIAVLFVLIAVEVIAFGSMTRALAWAARQQARRAVRIALTGGVPAFETEHGALRAARGSLDRIAQLEADIAAGRA